MATFGKISVLVLCVYLLQESQQFPDWRTLSGERATDRSESKAPEGVSLPDINGLKINQCLETEGVSDFEMEGIAGAWYEQLRTFNDFQPHKRCGTFGMRVVGENEYDNKCSFISSVTGKYTQFHIGGRINPRDNTLIHGYTSDTTIVIAGFFSRVMITDYVNYMALYYCIPFNQGLFYRDHVMVYSRNQTMPDEHRQIVLQELTRQGIDVSQLIGLGFDECPPGFDNYVKNDNL